MTDREKDLLNKLDAASRDIQVPDSISPEEIGRKLESGVIEKRKAKRLRVWVQWGAAIAATAVIVVGGNAAMQTIRQDGHGGTQVASTEDGQAGDGVETELRYATDYDEIYSYIEKSWEDQGYDRGFFVNSNDMEGAMMESTTADAAKSEDSAPAGSGGAAYSDTNVRTEGVGEADCVKTDGTYLYVLKENCSQIAIVDASEDRMEAISVIALPDHVQAREFYLSEGSLFVMGNQDKMKVDSEQVEIYNGTDAVLLSYDVSDVEHPKLAETLNQSGFYQTSRFKDGYLYLFSNFGAFYGVAKTDREAYVPSVGGELLTGDSIMLPQTDCADTYMVISIVDADDPGKIVEKKAILSYGGDCYVSDDQIFFYETKWKEGSAWSQGDSETIIRSVAYKDGKFGDAYMGTVNGYLNDSFSIDAYDGHLRLVTTVVSGPEEKNNVYVLDGKLKLVGTIEDLAKGEVVYSARFLGETGYFVTYKNTDPLFSVDLSDPKNPKILGALKIPGFSEYLHPYGEGLLLGIGIDTNEENGFTNGVKVSMFDISDPTDVKEVDTYTIEGTFGTDVGSDYRSVLVDTERNMIGFSAYGDQPNYYVFSYGEADGFQMEMEEDVNGYGWMPTRGLYIGERLFVVNGNAIESYRIGTYEKIDDILL